MFNKFYLPIIVLILLANDANLRAGNAFSLSHNPPMHPNKSAITSNKAEVDYSDNIIRMELSPAPEPQPALAVRFLPNLTELRHANAMLKYYAAFGSFPTSEYIPREIDEWITAPLVDVPAEKIDHLLNLFARPLHQAELAGCCDYCDWDPELSRGMYLTLPQLSRFRTLAKIIVLKARREIMDKNFKGAIGTLRTGFALARHIARGPSIAENRTATKVASMMLAVVQELVRQPDSPNLYWALASLPRPFIDITRTIDNERNWLCVQFPELKSLDTIRLSDLRAYDILQQICTMAGEVEYLNDPNIKSPEVFTSLMNTYLDARQQLLNSGMTEAELKKISPAQIVLNYDLHEYQKYKDNQLKCLCLPYPAGISLLRESGSAMSDYVDKHNGNMPNPMMKFMFGLERLYSENAQLQQKIAVLQAIESLRMYAATHKGKLPPTLDGVKSMPVPVDPFTGEAFSYKSRNDKAFLSVPLLRDSKLEIVTYEVSLKPIHEETYNQ